MTTELITIGKEKAEAIKKAASYLKRNEVVGFSTETVYGIGANIYEDEAVKKIYEAKGRNFNNPLAAHICSFSQVEELCMEIPDLYFRIADRFLPGPLSVIMKKKKSVSDLVTAGFDTVAIRYPDDEVCLELIREAGFPLAATSANLSTQVSAKNGQDAYNYLNGRISAVLDSGETKYKMESTIISLVGEVKILREGIIPREEIEDFLDMGL